MKLNKVFSLGMTLATALAFTACGNNDANNDAETKNETASTQTTDGNTSLDKLTVQFVPSREPDEIITATEPLKDMLKDELAKEGYDVEDVDISVGTSYEATGEAMSAGTVDVGFIPGGTYVTYDDGVDVILTATRDGLSVDSDDPKEWNDNAPIKNIDEQVTFYRALVLAGPSEKGKALAEKVNKGEELSWEDLNELNWAVMGPTSSAGYLYPSLWMKDKFDHTISDLSNAVQADSYASSFSRLATGQVDALVTYADARMDYAEQWQGEFGGANDIFDDVQVIGVTDKIMNDTISVSKTSEKMTPEFIEALQNAFINIGKTDEGKEVIAIYTHKGYEKADPAAYDAEREAQKLARDAN
ncbi:phosphate/phosphite/phosphonate ABC transporter substrate-binding protein [Anaerococcus cruorum]|uniref:phosphate/phosphite/phosphonate ABC transporter substrate-binding protein n=1 Tax=Anaerococcus sp. WGS1529 TaxID=3366812 RepID=UPI00372D5A4A